MRDFTGHEGVASRPLSGSIRTVTVGTATMGSLADPGSVVVCVSGAELFSSRTRAVWFASGRVVFAGSVDSSATGDESTGCDCGCRIRVFVVKAKTRANTANGAASHQCQPTPRLTCTCTGATSGG